VSGSLGIVVIGRNESERLRRCLDSATRHGSPVVYVDSGSTDDSVQIARDCSVDVVELDDSKPFTMALGRNAGFARLMEPDCGVDRVQFVDGDCELIDGWLAAAEHLLMERSEVGAVCGRRRERWPESSIYNRLTDMDWAGPTGEVLFSGGDVMMRAAAFRAAGGYAESMIAGEDPEVCVRIRQANWKIVRLDRDMTLHDAAMHRFGQWWRRAVRGGHAYAECAYLHRNSEERPWSRQRRSNWMWGLAIPVVSLATAWWTRGWSFLLLALYPVWIARIALRRRAEFGNPWPDCLLYGAFCMLGKIPQMLGQASYLWHRVRGRRSGLIEYKTARATAAKEG
jgi:glycosyltransferase involved in cell wall biosynthesis